MTIVHVEIIGEWFCCGASGVAHSMLWLLRVQQILRLSCKLEKFPSGLTEERSLGARENFARVGIYAMLKIKM